MNDELGSNTSRTDLPQRILGATQRRLEGRWEDAGAWSALCEETVTAWSVLPEIRWAMLVPHGNLGRDGAADELANRPALWAAATGRVEWDGLLPDEEFWNRLEEGAGQPVSGSGTPPGMIAARTEGPAKGWVARVIPGGRGTVMALVLGLDRDVAGEADRDPVVSTLVAVTEWLAPLLGQRRRLGDLAAEAAAVRSECETFSRLGELRARLAAVTAHELKTPLTSITAYAEVLEQHAGDPDFQHAPEFLRVIRGEADRLLRLVDRLLDSSRRGRMPALTDAGSVAVAPLLEEVQRTLAPQASARDLQLDGVVPEDLPAIDGDADLVRQVLLNLLGNALKFTPPHGRVSLSAHEDSSMVRLSVSDSGPGIPPRELRAIFQSFYRTRAARQTEGVGLGLSIVKEIVNLHGGYLDVTSRVGCGTTFSVLLPKQQLHTARENLLVHQGCDPALLERLCRHTIRLVAELAAARAVAVFMPGTADDELVVAAFQGLPGALEHVKAGRLGELARAVKGPAALVPGSSVLPPEMGGDVQQAGAAMVAPFELDAEGGRGLVVVARRLGGGTFGGDDLILLRVLAEVLGKAWTAALAPGADRRDHETVVDALAALTGLRRTGVPTADPVALRLLLGTGRRLGLSSYEIRLLQYAGALHDAGMVLIDPDVVLKPESLDVDERDHVDRHPQRGIDLLGPLVELPELRAIIRYHHERVDGRGYPEGRRGDTIPLGSRILAVVDAFFAMIRSRPWREGLSVAEATAELQRHAGTQFDEHVVTSFLGVLLEEGYLSEAVPQGPAGSVPRR
jgi:signal transduction histidine kinase